MLMVFHFFQTIGYYGFASWVPTLMIAAGITTTLELALFLPDCACRAAGAAAGDGHCGPRRAQMADRGQRDLHRRFRLALCAAENPAWLIACGVMLTCANNWMSFAFHAYQSELFPTRVRAQAVGFVYSWSRLSAILQQLFDRIFPATDSECAEFSRSLRRPCWWWCSPSESSARARAGLALEAISS